MFAHAAFIRRKFPGMVDDLSVILNECWELAGEDPHSLMGLALFKVEIDTDKSFLMKVLKRYGVESFSFNVLKQCLQLVSFQVDFHSVSRYETSPNHVYLNLINGRLDGAEYLWRLLKLKRNPPFIEGFESDGIFVQPRFHVEAIKIFNESSSNILYTGETSSSTSKVHVKRFYLSWQHSLSISNFDNADVEQLMKAVENSIFDEIQR